MRKLKLRTQIYQIPKPRLLLFTIAEENVSEYSIKSKLGEGWGEHQASLILSLKSDPGVYYC